MTGAMPLTRARSSGNWAGRRRMSFSEGMEKTVAWYLGNRQWLESVMDGSYREYYRKMYGARSAAGEGKK